MNAPDPDRWTRQVNAARTFDQLILNFDRNPGNLLIDGAWRLWMTGHGRAFKASGDVANEKALGDRCSRGMLAAMRRLDQPTLNTRAGRAR